MSLKQVLKPKPRPAVPLFMSQEHEKEDYGHGLAVEPSEPELKRPRRYKVLLLNDDYTPMHFVEEVLTLFFGYSAERATQLMLEVHTKGKAVCGVYAHDIAETKVAQVNEFAREHQHPLMCVMEAE